MNRHLYRYTFEPDVPLDEVEATLMLAIVAAECLYGQARVRLDASYTIDTEKRTCIVNASTQVGRNVADLFTGFLLREHGDDGFHVRRIAQRPENTIPA